MAKVTSAGILLYRFHDGMLEVWIAHMGGPFWARKDNGAWSVPKGEYEDELPRDVAFREFQEEIGAPPPPADYFDLGEFKQPSGKIITTFAAEAEFSVDKVNSNVFEMEWPKGSGQIKEFPEIDDARWFAIGDAREKLLKGQLPILDALEKVLAERGSEYASKPPAEPSLFDF